MDELDKYKPIGEAMSMLLFPYAEVVIHDLKSGKIAALFNNMSKRKVGDDSLIEEDTYEQDVIPTYFKVNWDGRKMKSVSAVIRNAKGKAVGLFCINLDVSKWDAMHQLVLDFISPKGEQPDFLFKNDWREKINLYVSSYVKEKGLRVESMDKKEMKKLLVALQKEGAFETKNAASYVADVLNISRATVYNYLKDV